MLLDIENRTYILSDGVTFRARIGSDYLMTNGKAIRLDSSFSKLIPLLCGSFTLGTCIDIVKISSFLTMEDRVNWILGVRHLINEGLVREIRDPYPSFLRVENQFKNSWPIQCLQIVNIFLSFDQKVSTHIKILSGARVIQLYFERFCALNNIDYKEESSVLKFLHEFLEMDLSDSSMLSDICGIVSVNISKNLNICINFRDSIHNSNLLKRI